MKFNFKMNPAVKRAFSVIGNHFKQSTIFNFLLFKPFLFILRNITRILGLINFLNNNKIFKVFRLLLKIFAIINVILGFGVILAYNELQLQEPVVLLSIIYAKFIDFCNHNIFDFIKNKISMLLIKILNWLEGVQDHIEPVKIESKPIEPKTKPVEYETDFRRYGIRREDFKKYYNIDFYEDKPFYYSPYFYIPCVTLLFGIGIYYYWEPITTILASYFFGSDQPKDPGTSSVSMGKKPMVMPSLRGYRTPIVDDTPSLLSPAQREMLSEYKNYFKSAENTPSPESSGTVTPEAGPSTQPLLKPKIVIPESKSPLTGSGETIWSNHKPEAPTKSFADKIIEKLTKLNES